VVELIPESYVNRLEPDQVFGRTAPLQVDLGCGDGSFLSVLAEQMPAHNFLGIERLAGRVRSAARKASGFSNVRVLRVETAYAVRYLLPPNSVDVFYLLFPDPWPKRRHHQRRIVTPEFMDSVVAALTNNGCFHIATDQQDYFREIERVVQACIHLQREPASGLKSLPRTTFERRFVAAGAPIYRMELRKISSVI
jgi:tRNA (guanine-N7-)-methyltransferase